MSIDAVSDGSFVEESTSWFAWGQDDHEITGRFEHPNGDPRTDQKIEVYAKGWFSNHYLGTMKTDRDGNFALRYKWRALPFQRQQDFVFKVYEETLPSVGLFRKEDRVVYETSAQKLLNERRKDLGSLKVELYEYQDGFPDLKQPENSAWRPQQWGFSYYFDLIKAGADEKLRDIFGGFWWSKPTVADVEEAYGVGDPSLKLDSATTIDMILNGIYPCNFKKTDKPNVFYADINWDRYDLDKSPQLPNARAYIEKNDDKLEIKEVVVQFRGEQEVRHPAGSPDFARALYLFNSSALVKGEVVSHLGVGHLWTGQASMAVFRSMNNNPVKTLLTPHLREVLEINKLGATAIFGPEGILNVSGLTVKGIHETLKDVLSGMCYSNFSPRTPVNSEHRFAKAENLYWNIVKEVVDTYFAKNEAKIKEYWYEVYYMSKNLVSNSLPHRPWEGVSDMNEWIDSKEIDNPNLPGRVVVDGELKSIRPITDNKVGPKAGEMEALKQFCAHAIFTSTFWHWAVHTSQRKWVTNLKIASLAPENHGRGTYGGTKVENAQRQLSITHTLVDFDRGQMMANPNGDVQPSLIVALGKHREDFEKLGFDIDELTYGTII